MNEHQLQETAGKDEADTNVSRKIFGMTERKESNEERVQRLYNSDGGPLVGWLFDEARRRRQDYKMMARELGVTYGYINQLRTGMRSPAQISQEMAEACGRYLGVPTVVVKLVCGSLRMSDFASRQENKEEVIERGLRQIQDDLRVRKLLPCNLHELSFEAKEAIVMLYAQTAGHDVMGLNELPGMLQLLQRAAVIHDENEFLAANGHRATS
ncbi:MAG: hypothetical protein ABI351_01135 [Herbaspirillum sp.]